MEKFKYWMLTLAESFDAWRVVPRFILICYGYLVWSLYSWYKSIAVYTQTQCDGVVLKVLLDEGVAFETARQMACNIVGTIGGPTGEQTMFVTTIIGLAAAIFGLYTGTGRRWQKEDSAGYSQQYQQYQQQPQYAQPQYGQQYGQQYVPQYQQPYQPQYAQPQNGVSMPPNQTFNAWEPEVDEELLEEKRNRELWEQEARS
jgi:hypothetical protein